MFKVFAGEDTFAAYNAAYEYAAKLAADAGTELEILDGDELSAPSDLMQHLDNMSFFSTGKVIFAKRLLANSRLNKFIEASLEELQNKPLVVWHEGKLDARTALSKGLQKLSLVIDFAQLAENEMSGWLVSEAKKSGVDLPRTLAVRMVAYKEGDRGILYQELQKLIVYAQATKKPIDQAILDSLTGADAGGDIWKFLDALAQGNKAAAMTEFEKLTRFSDNTQYLLSMLSRELTILAKVVWCQQHNKPLSSLKLHPFVLEKSMKKATRFSWTKLQKLSQALLRLDMGVKQGRLDEQIGLTVYLLSW